ncbi:hypothetical protein KAW55_03235 [bacterium]|nr:hypothetical protein [bacterium]
MKSNRAVDLTKVFNNYRGKWVALSSTNQTKVMGSGKTLKQAFRQSIKKGENDPIFLSVPADNKSFIL